MTTLDKHPVLLATDLSCRCDRALDRAALLAGAWQVPLIVLHVLELEVAHIPSDEAGQRRQDPATLARRSLEADLADHSVAVTLLVEEGDVAEIALRVAVEQRCVLTVVGLARGEPLGRFLLGTTVDRLIARSSLPLLIVRNRARAAYRRIVIASDFSVSSRHALETAVRLFPNAEMTLFHAHNHPARGLGDSADPASLHAIETGPCKAFLDACLIPAEARRRLRIVIRQGPPSLLLHDFEQEIAADLVVVGHGRSGLRQILIGSTAQEIIDRTPCDVLLVPEPRVQIA